MVYYEIKNKTNYNFMLQNKETTIMATDRILSHLLRQDFLASFYSPLKFYICTSNISYIFHSLADRYLGGLNFSGSSSELGTGYDHGEVRWCCKWILRGQHQILLPTPQRFEVFLSVLHFISKSPASMP